MTAVFQQIQCFGNKIIVQIPTVVTAELRVIRSKTTKGNITYDQIKIVGEFHFFQRIDVDRRFRIKAFCNISGDFVDLNTRKLIAFLHGCVSDKITGSAAKFSDFSGFDAKFLPSKSPHKLNDIFRRVVAVQHRTFSSFIFFFGQKFFEFGKMRIIFHKNIGQSAPAGKTG